MKSKTACLREGLALERYRYIPLNNLFNGIRLLTLYPGAFDDPIIIINIKFAVLTERQTPQFEALSYAWGDPSQRRRIFVKTGESVSSTSTTGLRYLNVTSNLYTALRYLRLKEHPRTFWIDAICVDQDNLDERSKQILRMPDIYKSAMQVIAWLGPESSDSSVAMRLINGLGSKLRHDLGTNRTMAALDSDPDPGSWDFEKSLQLNEPKWSALGDLLSRAWFQRLWILQEILFGRKRARIVCGLGQASYENFISTLHYLNGYKSSEAPQKRARELRVLIELEAGQSGHELVNLLALSRGQYCSDPKDKIYAILNLVSAKWRAGIEPNYSMSVDEVFRSVVVRNLEALNSLHILKYCSLHTPRMKMPTWVPDWSAPEKDDRLQSNIGFLTRADAYLEGNDILIASGVWITEICEMRKDLLLPIPELRYQAAKAIKAIFAALSDTIQDCDAKRKVEDICRASCCARFSESFVPLRNGYPDRHETAAYMKECLHWSGDDLEEPPDKYSLYINFVNSVTKGRLLAITRDRDPALVPDNSRTGDMICQIFGCDVPLVVRPDGPSEFKVVGPCYVDGNMAGEALLDPLPDNWTRVLRYFEGMKNYHGVYLDADTGKTQPEDPRLGLEPLPAGWRIASHDNEDAYNWFINDTTGEETAVDPRIHVDALKKRGVKVEQFRLV